MASVFLAKNYPGSLGSQGGHIVPDGSPIQQELIYRRARRDKFAPLIMIAGPPGSGKTVSGIRLARGMAGPDGKICLADTDNGRAKLYADEFVFDHLDLREPYRPKLFEDAAIEAQKQGAIVFIIDNFMHEHAGPGGLLEYHEQELERLTRGDLSKRDALNMVAWIKPKLDHKHMRERLYLLNMPVILCCGAERKVAMVKQTEGQHKGKTIPVDQGLQPICGADIPWAMTISLMLTDVARPGVPVPIKALLPALRNIIKLDKPLDEATGAAIAAWASGKQVRTPPADKPERPGASTREPGTDPSGAGESGSLTPGSTTPPADLFPGDRPPASKRAHGTPPTPSEVQAEVEAMITRFYGCENRRDHLTICKETRADERLRYLKKNGFRGLHGKLDAAIKASWQRTERKPATTS